MSMNRLPMQRVDAAQPLMGTKTLLPFAPVFFSFCFCTCPGHCCSWVSCLKQKIQRVSILHCMNSTMLIHFLQKRFLVQSVHTAPPSLRGDCLHKAPHMIVCTELLTSDLSLAMK